jgi:hypothetical protein
VLGFLDTLYLCSKGTRLVVNKLVEEHMVPVLDIPIDGRIVLLHAFRPPVPASVK